MRRFGGSGVQADILGGFKRGERRPRKGGRYEGQSLDRGDSKTAFFGEAPRVPNQNAVGRLAFGEDRVIFRSCQNAPIQTEGTTLAIHDFRDTYPTSTAVRCPQSSVAVTLQEIWDAHAFAGTRGKPRCLVRSDVLPTVNSVSFIVIRFDRSEDKTGECVSFSLRSGLPFRESSTCVVAVLSEMTNHEPSGPNAIEWMYPSKEL
jgi:hypothetical protein